MRVRRERVANFVEMRSTKCRRGKRGVVERGAEGGFYIRCEAELINSGLFFWQGSGRRF
jgi:hypothetical protein